MLLDLAKTVFSSFAGTVLMIVAGIFLCLAVVFLAEAMEYRRSGKIRAVATVITLLSTVTAALTLRLLQWIYVILWR